MMRRSFDPDAKKLHGIVSAPKDYYKVKGIYRLKPFLNPIKKVEHMNRHSEDLAEIKKIASDWNAGWESGNAEALLALYEENPVLMPQGQPAVFGKDAIRLLYLSVFKDFTIKGKGKVVEVEVSGNLGYFWSSYSLTATPKAGGDPIFSKGKSLFIVKRQDDNSWKIARLIDNSDGE